MENIKEISKLKDKELLEKFEFFSKQEKEMTAQVVAHLAEIDKRKLYLDEGYSSLFTYVTQKYRYSESAAYRRIQAARLSQRFPDIIPLIKKGELNLMTLSLIAPHLKEENKEKIFPQVFKKSTRAVEYFISSFSQKQDQKQEMMRDKIRILSPMTSEIRKMDMPEKSKDLDLFSKENPAQTAQNFTTSAGSNPIERRVKIEFCAKESLAKKIERAKEVLRHKYPQGKLEDIFEEAMELLLEKKDPERKIKRIEEKEFHGTKENRETLRNGDKDDREVNKDSKKQTRYIPQSIQREVYKRDEGKCSYVSRDGKPCGERNFLELDHLRPWALGGDHTFENLELLCRAHNQWRKEKTFGKWG